MIDTTGVIPITEEAFDAFIEKEVWSSPYHGDEMKIMIPGPGFLAFWRWFMVNKKWKYRKGKSGKILRRPSKYYDECVAWEKKLNIQIDKAI